MAKDFEDQFKELQLHMVRVCMEYAGFQEDVEAIYIYVACDNDRYDHKWLYKINGKLVQSYEKHNSLSGEAKPFNSSSDKFLQYVFLLGADVQSMQRVCRENDEKMPTEMKIMYDAKTNMVGMDYSDDPLVSPNPAVPGDANKWWAEIAAALEQGTEKNIDDYDESVGLYGGVTMRNIEVYPMEKYSSDAYEKVAFDVYRHKEANNYHFAFSAQFNTEDRESAVYFLEALVEDCGLYFGEYYGREQEVGGVKKLVTEVHTLKDSIEDLVQILNFSTIVGNTVSMVDFGDSVFYAKHYGMGKATYNGLPFEIPVYGYRDDWEGSFNFAVRYPELQVKSKFEKGFTIRGPKNNALLRYVVVKDSKFYVVMSVGGKEQALRFSLQGFEKVVDDID